MHTSVRTRSPVPRDLVHQDQRNLMCRHARRLRPRAKTENVRDPECGRRVSGVDPLCPALLERYSGHPATRHTALPVRPTLNSLEIIPIHRNDTRRREHATNLERGAKTASSTKEESHERRSRRWVTVRRSTRVRRHCYRAVVEGFRVRSTRRRLGRGDRIARLLVLLAVRLVPRSTRSVTNDANSLHCPRRGRRSRKARLTHTIWNFFPSAGASLAFISLAKAFRTAGERSWPRSHGRRRRQRPARCGARRALLLARRARRRGGRRAPLAGLAGDGFGRRCRVSKRTTPAKASVRTRTAVGGSGVGVGGRRARRRS